MNILCAPFHYMFELLLYAALFLTFSLTRLDHSQRRSSVGRGLAGICAALRILPHTLWIRQGRASKVTWSIFRERWEEGKRNRLLKEAKLMGNVEIILRKPQLGPIIWGEIPELFRRGIPLPPLGGRRQLERVYYFHRVNWDFPCTYSTAWVLWVLYWNFRQV